MVVFCLWILILLPLFTVHVPIAIIIIIYDAPRNLHDKLSTNIVEFLPIGCDYIRIRIHCLQEYLYMNKADT